MVRFYSGFKVKFPSVLRISFFKLFRSSILVGTFFLAGVSAFAQQPAVKSQEVSDVDGVPVLLKHLPEWESVKNNAKFAVSTADLQAALGERPVFDLIEFTGGTEAATAPYSQGKLLIVEYTSPQTATDADAKFVARLTQTPQNPPIIYRRIGNYSAFVFDAADRTGANELLDRVQYEKTIQWLGEDPFLYQKLERYFIHTTRDIFISTVLWIIMGFGLSIATGVLAGFIYYRYREQERAARTAFSDAGGLTRLNLDDLSEPLVK